MTILQVPEMHCEKCVERIGMALEGAGLTYKISRENKTVMIDGCEHCVATAKELLDDLGFDAE